MLGALRLRQDGRASAASGPAFLAVALATILVAADAPLGRPASDGDGLSADTGDLHSALATEEAWLKKAVALSWGAAPVGEGDPSIRSRAAADALQREIVGRYPHSQRGATVDLLEPAIRVFADGEGALPGEFRLRLTGSLISSEATAGARSLTVEAEAPDPERPRARRFLEKWLGDQADDPRSVAAAAVRRTVAEALAEGGPLGEERLAALLDESLDQAAAALSAELAPKPFGEDLNSTVFSGLAYARFLPEPDPREVLEHIEADGFAGFLRSFLWELGALPAGRALASDTSIPNRTLLLAARSLLASNVTPLRALLAALWPALPTLVEEAIALIRLAVADLVERLRVAAESAAASLARLSPAAPEDLRAAASAVVHLSARAARLEKGEGRDLSVRPGGLIVPFAAAATVVFTLEATARAQAGGRDIVANATLPMRVDVAAVSTRPFGLPTVAAAASGASLPEWASERFAPFSQAAEFLEDVRRQMDRRLLTFREAVSERLAQSSASGLARLAFRILDGLSDNDTALAARTLFDLLERYLADDLRDALTVNFSLFGVELTLIPDPVRQQVALQHEDGPHTFGVRLRRLTAEGNPLEGKYPNAPSLALELFWRFEKPPVSAALTVDPFLRTDDGLLRFDLTVRAGDGIAMSVVAPRVVRRQATFELSLSDFLPGGLPLGPTPSGGALFFDAGVRVEIARVALPTAARFALRAFEGALFDVLENQTVREVAEQLSASSLARRFLDRFVARLADVFAEEASRFVLRAETFARFRWFEAAGTLSATLEVGLAIIEPVVAFREAASGLSAVARTVLDSALAGRPPAPAALDWIPSAVHTRVGLASKLSLRGGLDGLPLPPPLRNILPGAEVEQSIFLSLGALYGLLGRRGVHGVSEYAIGWEGFSTKMASLLPWRLASGDTLEAAHLRVESLTGPRLLISEVLPSPAGKDHELEFIELYNPGWSEELLSGWSLTDASGRSFTLPAGTRIPPGGTLLLARSAAPFFARFGAAPEVATLTLSLNDGGDRITLWNPFGMPSDEVAWGIHSPLGRTPTEDRAFSRLPARSPPVELPGSALRFTGSPLDFVLEWPTPGRAG